jgi:hypothetical protein
VVNLFLSFLCVVCGESLFVLLKVEPVREVERIEREIRKLGRADLAALREWFRKYDAEAWDRQIEEDVQNGRLDLLVSEAIADYKAGKATEI